MESFFFEKAEKVGNTSRVHYEQKECQHFDSNNAHCQLFKREHSKGKQNLLQIIATFFLLEYMISNHF